MLVVRPDPAAGETIGALAAKGIPALACPPSRIVPATPLPPVPEGTDAIVLTSANAVRVMGPALAGRAAWCVGSRTAEAARDAGADPVHSADGDGQALAALLARQPAMHLFHARGADAAVDLAALLTGTDHRVDSRIVYRAEAIAALAPRVGEALARGQVALAGFWSPRGARLFRRALDSAGQPARDGLSTARLLALSPAVADALDGLGQHIIVAPHPDGASMLTTIVREWS